MEKKPEVNIQHRKPLKTQLVKQDIVLYMWPGKDIYRIVHNRHTGEKIPVKIRFREMVIRTTRRRIN
jgi:hypothetical protein